MSKSPLGQIPGMLPGGLPAAALGKASHRWHTCSQCEQHYHGVVSGALGWACWKTYVGRPETNFARDCAMTSLGNGLNATKHLEDALSVYEAQLATLQRIGAPEANLLVVQSNLASTYSDLGRLEEAGRLQREVYFGFSKVHGKENYDTLREASNYALTLIELGRDAEAKAFTRNRTPVTRRALGDNNDVTLKMRRYYAIALYRDAGASLNDLREAVTTLEDVEQTARRVLGSAHPTIIWIERSLREARAVLRARETPCPHCNRHRRTESEAAALPPLPDSDSESDEAPELLSPADVVSQLGNAVSDGKYRA